MAARELLVEIFPDDDLLLLAKAVREFGERELVLYLRQLGREEFPERFIALAANRGFLGTAIPEEYGGHGGNLEGLLLVLEGLAACDGSLALTLVAHESLAATHLLLGGSNEQKRRYLPDLTAGKKIAAWCLTEPQAGSNIFQDTRTKLQRTSQGWRLSGEKTFITNGCHADLFVVIAQGIGQDNQPSGLTACVLERNGNEDRITATPLHDKMGMCRSDTAALKFDDVPVLEDAVLGPVGSADKVARRVLLRARIGAGALALGLARDALERAAVYAQQRQVAGGSLFDQPLTRAKLCRMEDNLWAAWQAVRSAAQCADRSRPFKVQAYMAKVFATETALRITDEAIQILGGYGYMRDYKVEQNYRDARLLTIGEGASEILRFAIAGNLLDKTPGAGDVLAPLDNLKDAAGPHGGSMSDTWGPSWGALQLAAEALDLVREQMEIDGQRADSAAAWQCKAVAFADLATKLWVAKQVVLSGTVLFNRGSASQKRLKLVRTFLVNSSIEICHQASELLRILGLHDARVFSSYIEATQIGAALDSSPPAPLPRHCE